MFEPDFDLSKREHRICKIIWGHQPIFTSALVALCEDQLKWNKSTTLTYVRCLIQKGILENKESTIKMLVSKEVVALYYIDALIESTFCGSATELVAFWEKYYQMEQ